MGAVTFLIRAMPFIAGNWLQKHPVVARLGRFSPLAIMTLLLLHSMVGNAVEHSTGPWPEVIAIAVVVALQWRWKSPLASILAGTVIYVLFRNYY